MGKQRFTEEFKQEAIGQVLERGYSVKEVSERLGVSTPSLYIWLKKTPDMARLPNRRKNPMT